MCSVNVFGLIRDVTNRKVAEQNKIDFELKKKDVLLREVHHRIKNTLQGVMSLLQQHMNKKNSTDMCLSMLFLNCIQFH